ncbi:MAG: tyrosine-type recombinase/integrase [Actinophytocola sp.]|uniref:tyrosine-type recombinase/integrase n=1 Tax=Actinophytocola sp. TaxID=1872138 RepID=UPI001320AA93|nr:tyrosine-type recombinase/integrase [Actinophytocola sp.]MPZ81602.1 tyrosine-type recombinase/integrase [Actinophytocola sp.]
MAKTYKVRIWKIEVRKNARGKVTSYRVRWEVAGEDFRESFKRDAQADSFRSDLLSAQRSGEAFDTTTGLPISRARKDTDASWYDFTCKYVDMKWPDLAATARQTTAEALIRVASVFVPNGNSATRAGEIRSALRQWGYNTELRTNGVIPDDVRMVLDWCSRNTMSVRTASEPDTLRRLQRAVTRRLDGKPFAPTVARKTRSVLWNALDYAVEEGLIDANPLAGVKWTAMPKGKRKVDKRAVPNPIQARTLLNAVRDTPRSGKRLVAYFGTMYYSALRPEEAVELNKRNLAIPEPVWDSERECYVYEWGDIHLDEAAPHVGARWTDAGTPRDKRQLKSRAAGEGRTVPCPPELTELLWEHINRYGFGEDGRLFRGERGGQIPMITYTRTWRAARRRALIEEAQATPLAARPYDLRHAAVSTWLTAGVDPATVAEWAGHSLSVLMEVYAACLYGQDVVARRRVQEALGHRT